MERESTRPPSEEEEQEESGNLPMGTVPSLSVEETDIQLEALDRQFENLSADMTNPLSRNIAQRAATAIRNATPSLPASVSSRISNPFAGRLNTRNTRSNRQMTREEPKEAPKEAFMGVPKEDQEEEDLRNVPIAQVEVAEGAAEEGTEIQEARPILESELDMRNPPYYRSWNDFRADFMYTLPPALRESLARRGWQGQGEGQRNLVALSRQIWNRYRQHAHEIILPEYDLNQRLRVLDDWMFGQPDIILALAPIIYGETDPRMAETIQTLRREVGDEEASRQLIDHLRWARDN